MPDAQARWEPRRGRQLDHSLHWWAGVRPAYEKFVLYVEMCQILAESTTPIEVSPAELASEAIANLDSGGHFFGNEHTLERYRTASNEPILFDRSNFERWI